MLRIVIAAGGLAVCMTSSSISYILVIESRIVWKVEFTPLFFAFDSNQISETKILHPFNQDGELYFGCLLYFSLSNLGCGHVVL